MHIGSTIISRSRSQTLGGDGWDASLDSEISIYKSFSSTPVSVSLMSWLHWNKYGCNYTSQVLEYRRTGDKNLKDTLPCATLSGVFQGGRRKEHLVSRTGWVALDIDGKDNPGKNAEFIRDQLGKITNIAFSGLSVSGEGVWVLLKLSHPECMQEHFEMLKRDFSTMGIQLDETKGKNVNDARFLSYDPDAIIKEEVEVYTKRKMHVVQRRDYTPSHSNSALEELKAARQGERNTRLFRAARALYWDVKRGRKSEQEVEHLLYSLAEQTGLSHAEIMKTIESARQYV